MGLDERNRLQRELETLRAQRCALNTQVDALPLPLPCDGVEVWQRRARVNARILTLLHYLAPVWAAEQGDADQMYMTHA